MCSPLSGPHTKKALPSCACSVGRVWQMPNMRMKRATKRSFTCERTKALWNWAEVFYLFLVYHRVFVAQKHDSLGLGQHVRGPMTDLQGDASHGGANKRTTTRHWRYLSPAEKMSLHHLWSSHDSSCILQIRRNVILHRYIIWFRNVPESETLGFTNRRHLHISEPSQGDGTWVA